MRLESLFIVDAPPGRGSHEAVNLINSFFTANLFKLCLPGQLPDNRDEINLRKLRAQITDYREDLFVSGTLEKVLSDLVLVIEVNRRILNDRAQKPLFSNIVGRQRKIRKILPSFHLLATSFPNSPASKAPISRFA